MRQVRTRRTFAKGSLTAIGMPCTACKATIELNRQPPWRLQRRAVVLYLVAGATTLVWIFVLDRIFPFPRDDYSPTIRKYVGFVWFAALFTPGGILGFLANRLPRIRTIECPSCDAVEVITPDEMRSRLQRGSKGPFSSA